MCRANFIIVLLSVVAAVPVNIHRQGGGSGTGSLPSGLGGGSSPSLQTGSPGGLGGLGGGGSGSPTGSGPGGQGDLLHTSVPTYRSGKHGGLAARSDPGLGGQGSVLPTSVPTYRPGGHGGVAARSDPGLGGQGSVLPSSVPAYRGGGSPAGGGSPEPTGSPGGLGSSSGGGDSSPSIEKDRRQDLGSLGDLTSLLPTSIPTGLLGGLGSLTGGDLPIPTGLLGSLTGGSDSPLLTTKKRRQSLGSLLGGLMGSDSDSGSSSSSSSGSGSTSCKDVTVIFARGTDDPSLETANLGYVVGPGLQTDTTSALGAGNVNVQGVDYAASMSGIASESVPGGGAGTQAMVNQTASVLSQCPSTQIVLSGYSQGAMLVHNTMDDLPAAQAAQVKAAVTFGDPLCGTAPKGIASGRFKSFCASDDSICDGSVASSPSAGGTKSASTTGHLGYGSDTGSAAAFIKSVVTV